jgi:hypothetical protein
LALGAFVKSFARGQHSLRKERDGKKEEKKDSFVEHG